MTYDMRNAFHVALAISFMSAQVPKTAYPIDQENGREMDGLPNHIQSTNLRKVLEYFLIFNCVAVLTRSNYPLSINEY